MSNWKALAVVAGSVAAVALTGCTAGGASEPVETSTSTSGACTPSGSSVTWGETTQLEADQYVLTGTQVLTYADDARTVSPTSLGGVVGIDPPDTLDELAAAGSTKQEWLQAIVKLAQSERKVTSEFGLAPSVPDEALTEPKGKHGDGTWVVGVTAPVVEVPFTVSCEGDVAPLGAVLRGSQPIGTVSYLYDCAEPAPADANSIELQSRAYCP
jgi:hypothetical protein